MLNRMLLMAVGLISTHTLFGQRHYNDVSEGQRTEVFYDAFDDNQHNWFIGSQRKGRREAHIQDGHYVWKSKSDFYQEHASWNRVSLAQHRDFEIETAIKFVEGNPRESSTSLSWGRSDRGSFFFGFKKDEFFINQWHKISGLTHYIKRHKTPHLRSGEYNKLTVRKVDGTYHFFINEQWVHTMPFKKFFGPNVGFESTNLIHVDYLRVSYLNPDQPSSPLATQPDTSSDSISAESHLAQVLEGDKPEASDVIPNEEPQAEGHLATQPVFSSYDSLEEPSSSLADGSEGRPVITITEPSLTRGFKRVPLQTVRIAGQATDPDGIQEVTINEQPAWLRSDGSFSLEAPLHVGDNAFTVTATDRQQQQATTTFSIHREVPATEKRLALVIGNGAYEQGGELRNPLHDANAMKVTLEQLGFTVLKYENCGQNQIKRAMDEFGQQLKGYDVGLFFYAGHGVQVDGNNYLIPVDARLTSAHDVEFDCVRADRVLAKMEAANSQTNIVVLDACRDNPFERSWSRGTRGNGLAFMNAPRGSLVAYATAPGQTASDGGGTHGVYTEALLEHLPTPGITIEQVFKRVRGTVSKKSEGKQVPWESTSLTGDFYFKR